MKSLTSSAALVLIDVQRAIDHPSWGRRNNPDAERNMARLLHAWRATRRPIVHVRHVSLDPLSTYRAGQPDVEFKQEVLPMEGEEIVTKHRQSAFIGTRLEAWLREHGAGAVVIAGVITNNSVEATARMAANLGFETCVVSDATATFDKKDFDGRLRSAQEVHAMSLANLQGEYASVLGTEQVLRALGG